MATIKSIEEKAKAYDEALERAKHSDGIYPSAKELKEYIFPELRESEDEKIRKAIIWGMNALKDQKKETFAAISIDDCIAWLEKQGEQPKKHDVCDNCDQQGSCVSPCSMKLVEKQNTVVVIPKFRVGDVIRPKGSTAEYTIESISGESYHGKGWGLHISCDNDYELVEQKPAEWSTNDEFAIKILNTVCDEYLRISTYKGTEFRHEVIDAKTWLKSLKDRYTWLPSDEQMRVLDLAIRCGINRGTTEETTLVSLFNDLKKLK